MIFPLMLEDKQKRMKLSVLRAILVYLHLVTLLLYEIQVEGLFQQLHRYNALGSISYMMNLQCLNDDQGN